MGSKLRMALTIRAFESVDQTIDLPNIRYDIYEQNHSHPEGFYWGHQCSRTFSPANMQSYDGNKPRERFQPVLTYKSEVDVGAIRCQHILVSHFTCTPHGMFVWDLFTQTLFRNSGGLLWGTHFTIEVTIFRCYIATDLRYGQYYFLRFNLDEA